MKKIISATTIMVIIMLTSQSSALISTRIGNYTSLDYLLMSYRFGILSSGDQIYEINNVPVVIRDVPVHPDDIKKCSMDSSWSKPIGNINSKGGRGRRLIFADISVGPALSFETRRATYCYEKSVIKFGIGGEFCLQEYSNYEERNYLVNDRPTIGDSSSYKRGYGTALTWYAIGNSSIIQPYIYFEAKLIFRGKGFYYCGQYHSTFPSLSLGYKINQERYTAKNGWDRHDSHEEYRKFYFLTLVTGTPYFLMEFYPVGLGVEIGFKHFIKKIHSSDLAKQSDVEFLKLTPIIGVNLKITI